MGLCSLSSLLSHIASIYANKGTTEAFSFWLVRWLGVSKRCGAHERWCERAVEGQRKGQRKFKGIEIVRVDRVADVLAQGLRWGHKKALKEIVMKAGMTPCLDEQKPSVT